MAVIVMVASSTSVRTAKAVACSCQKKHSSRVKAQLLKASRERLSLRALARVFSVARKTLSRWLTQAIRQLPPCKQSLAEAKEEDVLELDELWSFVGKKQNRQWLWVALCRRTRQVIAYVIGDRSNMTCLKLGQKLPKGYRQCLSYSDFWKAYEQVLPKNTHRCVGKDSGETAHVERWNNTLRQRMARFGRKTLSFSKSLAAHHLFTKWFIYHYNLDCLASCT
jgi:insertion element IS1 protein InsB